MNLRTKLLTPPLLIFCIITLVMHFFWRPIQLEQEEAKIVERETDLLRNYAPKLAYDLLVGDLGAVYAVLEELEEVNTDEQYAVKIFNSQGKRLYPLVLTAQEMPPHTLALEHLLEAEGRILGTLHVSMNWSERYEETASDLWVMEITGLLLFGLTLFIIYTLQELFIRRPLLALKTASSQLAGGNFEVPLPVESQDEIGALAKTFDQMRRSLLETQTALKSSASEANDNAIRFLTVLNSMPGALITIGKDGNIADFNSAAETVFGYRKNEVFGKSYTRLIPED